MAFQRSLSMVFGAAILLVGIRAPAAEGDYTGPDGASLIVQGLGTTPYQVLDMYQKLVGTRQLNLPIRLRFGQYFLKMGIYRKPITIGPAGLSFRSVPITVLGKGLSKVTIQQVHGVERIQEMKTGEKFDLIEDDYLVFVGPTVTRVKAVFPMPIVLATGNLTVPGTARTPVHLVSTPNITPIEWKTGETIEMLPAQCWLRSGSNGYPKYNPPASQVRWPVNVVAGKTTQEMPGHLLVVGASATPFKVYTADGSCFVCDGKTGTPLDLLQDMYQIRMGTAKINAPCMRGATIPVPTATFTMAGPPGTYTVYAPDHFTVIAVAKQGQSVQVIPGSYAVLPPVKAIIAFPDVKANTTYQVK